MHRRIGSAVKRKPAQEKIPVSRDSLEKVFTDNQDLLKGLICRYVRRPEDVEDLVQETFVRTFEARKKSPIRHLKAYLFKTAKHLSFKHCARHANKLTDYVGDLCDLEVYENRDSPYEEMQAHEQFSIFCEAVAELPLQCRRVFILKKIYGLSHGDIAKKLNISLSTTMNHLAKGISRCTMHMERKGYLGSDCGDTQSGVHDASK